MMHDDAIPAGYGRVSGLQIAMVSLAPLLADLIRHGLDNRIGSATFVEFSDLQHATRLQVIAPDVVIVGALAAAQTMRIQRLFPRAKMLTISPDLAWLVDLDTGEPAAFTLDELANCLRR
jgi:hypothetical protein